MNKNVKTEEELYEPMRLWLHSYLKDRYKNAEIITIDSHSEKLFKVLKVNGVEINEAIGLNIQIDVLGIVKDKRGTKLIFIEAKKTSLSIRDLGQLWAYCKLVSPDEAFLFTSADIGCLSNILKTLNREDILNFGDGKKIRKMKVAKWDIEKRCPDISSIIPKI